MTNEQHNTYIGYAFLGHGAFQLVMTFIMSLMFFFIFNLPGGPGEPGFPPAIMGLMIGFMVVIQFLFTMPSLIAAYGLLKRKSWARVASIVAAITSAMNVPFGTAACVYSLWFFLGDNWKSVYEKQGWPEPPRPQFAVGGVDPRWSGYRENEKGEVIYQHVDPPDWR